MYYLNIRMSATKISAKLNIEYISILEEKTMATQFIFDNLFYFPLLVLVILAIYLIQFCSCISPNRIEFDGDSKREMNIMNRYNILSENVFSIYLGCILAGIVVAVFVQSTWILIMLMILQLVYILPVGFVMFAMYERSKRYWQEKDIDTLQQKYI